MKIAIIGSGISGLGAGFCLSQDHDVTIYEKEPQAGGHSRTLEIDTPEGPTRVDTGFIVFNRRNYPHLVGLFKKLNVPVHESDMSFGASIRDGWLEYGTANYNALFAQRRNLARPAYLKMLYDITRFHRLGAARIGLAPDMSLGAWVQSHGFGRWFLNYFLLPMGGAIWSMPVADMLDYPAEVFLRFFDNHGLLGIDDAPQWYTVAGGSRTYVELITALMKDRVLTDCAVKKVIRHETGVEIIDEWGERHQFDKVVMACHSDQALRLIDAPTNAEKEILGAIRYQTNHVVLHRDISFLPKRRAAWSSWVYHSAERHDERDKMSLSYWMNNLQPLGLSFPVIVTLNPYRMPPRDMVYNETELAHPVFDQAAINAQTRIGEIQGTDRIYYCGAWHGFGFHEDGLSSAVNMCKMMNVEAPWR